MTIELMRHNPAPPPIFDGEDRRFFVREIKRLSETIEQHRQKIIELEATIENNLSGGA